MTGRQLSFPLLLISQVSQRPRLTPTVMPRLAARKPSNARLATGSMVCPRCRWLSNIAGSPAMYLEKQLKAFRSEERKDETMNVVAKPLSDDDIADLAAWYSGLTVDVTLPN